MATNTTNFDLVKPAGSDNYDIDSFHNGSMDKIDSALQGLGTGLAIISKNNTHGAISSGEYVYVHGHGSLAEGLYKANTNIAANGTLTSSNLTAVSGGLGTQVASLSNQIANIGTQVNGTLYNPACPNQGAETTVALIDLTPGTWIVIATGWSPLGNTSVSSTTAMIGQTSSGSICSATLTRRFNLVGIAKVTTNTQYYMKVTNWESSSKESVETNYTFTATRII